MNKLLLIGFMLITGCGQMATKQSDYTSEAPASTPTRQSDVAYADAQAQTEVTTDKPAQSVLQPRKIIKNAELTLEIARVDSFLRQTEQLALAQEGYVANTQISNRQQERQDGHIILRVPSARFDIALKSLRTLAKKIENENVKADDVSEEFYDLEARLNNKYRTEKRLLDILDRARTVEEILQVEAQLDEARGAIEQMEGRKKFLQNQIDWSTITIYFHEPYPAFVSGSPGFVNRLERAIKNGFDDALGVLTGLLYFGIAGLPLFILIGLGIFWLRRRRKRIGL